MKQFLLSILGLCLFATASFTQEIEISGQIIDKETNEAVPFVHIINASINKGTVSNTEGRFWIKMDRRDTLQFSAIGFETYAFILQPNISTDKIDVTIALNTSTMELAPVKVFAFRDEQALKRALIEMDAPLEEQEQFTIPGLPSKKTRDVEGGGMGIGGPLTMIAKAFSKEEKEKKLLKKYEKAYDFQKVLTSKYNETVVMEITNLPEDKVEDSMKFCVLEDSFIYRATEYDLAVVLNQCLLDFNKLEEH